MKVLDSIPEIVFPRQLHVEPLDKIEIQAGIYTNLMGGRLAYGSKAVVIQSAAVGIVNIKILVEYEIVVESEVEQQTVHDIDLYPQIDRQRRIRRGHIQIGAYEMVFLQQIPIIVVAVIPADTGVKIEKTRHKSEIASYFGRPRHGARRVFLAEYEQVRTKAQIPIVPLPFIIWREGYFCVCSRKHSGKCGVVDIENVQVQIQLAAETSISHLAVNISGQIQIVLHHPEIPAVISVSEAEIVLKFVTHVR